MKVLLVGATGNLGLRLVSSLLTHGHTVVAYVRSPKKLEIMLSPSAYSQIGVVQGDATDVVSIKKAISNYRCDAVINTAGVAAVAPWGNSDLPAIFRAVLTAVQETGKEKQKPLRVWFLAGMGVLHYPETKSLLSN